MADYRVYFIDRLNHIRGAIDVEAADDAEAVAKAGAHGAHEVLEVWQGARQVRRLESRTWPSSGVEG